MSRLVLIGSVIIALWILSTAASVREMEKPRPPSAMAILICDV